MVFVFFLTKKISFYPPLPQLKSLAPSLGKPHAPWKPTNGAVWIKRRPWFSREDKADPVVFSGAEAGWFGFGASEGGLLGGTTNW